MIRGIAQSRQVPLLDLHFSLLPLEGYGLAGDGIHLNTYKKDGAYHPCDFTQSGLNFGMNMRNLVSLIALDTLRWTVVLQEDMVEDGKPLTGTGSIQEPFIVSQLPFSDSRNTTAAPPDTTRDAGPRRIRTEFVPAFFEKSAGSSHVLIKCGRHRPALVVLGDRSRMPDPRPSDY